MQRFSFDFGDPIFDLAGWRVSVQITTLENTYGLDPGACGVTDDAGVLRVECDRLTWAGGQRSATGSASLRASRTADGIEIWGAASHVGLSVA